jgi:hypothetical protein
MDSASLRCLDRIRRAGRGWIAWLQVSDVGVMSRDQMSQIADHLHLGVALAGRGIRHVLSKARGAVECDRLGMTLPRCQDHPTLVKRRSCHWQLLHLAPTAPNAATPRRAYASGPSGRCRGNAATNHVPASDQTLLVSRRRSNEPACISDFCTCCSRLPLFALSNAVGGDCGRQV